MFISPADASRLLKVEPDQIALLDRAGRLISVRFGKELRYPLWQFDTRDQPATAIPHLSALRKATRADMSAVDVAVAMTSVSSAFDVDDRPASPRDWLINCGEPEPVEQLLTGHRTSKL
jgi:hypothetical protein